MVQIISLFVKFYFKFVFSVNSAILRLSGVTMGKNIRSLSPFGVEAPHNINLGNDVFIGPRVYLAGYNGITIGNNVMISGDSSLLSADHDFSKKNIVIDKQGLQKEKKGIVIEDNVWVGTRVIILKKITVGTGAVIGAGAVVTKDVPAYTIVAGNPAKVIKQRV